MDTVKPGDELDRLLEFADGDEETVAVNIAKDPNYWCLMLAIALPFFMTVRLSQASFEWTGGDEFTF